MIERVLAFSVRQRWLVLLAAVAAAVAGAWSLTKLPIDAVPDVTNVQVQVNAIAPALTPIEIEKQVTFPIETALAGTPGLETTRSFSRNGFAQVTVVFTDRTDIYFARQQVAERLNEAKTRRASSSGWARSRPASAKSIGGRWNIRRPAKVRRCAMVSPGGRRMAPIKRPKANASPTNSSAPFICERFRTGSFGRRCGRCRASPAPTPSAVTSSSTTCNRIRRD
jgi:hypothetical protein